MNVFSLKDARIVRTECFPFLRKGGLCNTAYIFRKLTYREIPLRDFSTRWENELPISKLTSYT